jgi:hypothetical protein
MIDFRNTLSFMDAATDMEDFDRDVEEVSTQITFYDRIY